MADENCSNGRSANPLYFPVERETLIGQETPATLGNTDVALRSRFRYDDSRHVWFLGPMSQNFMKAQVRWAELKLWRLYHRLGTVRRSQWASLMNLGLRLACSWYFQFDCMATCAVYLVRRVRNTFCIQRPKTLAELKHLVKFVYGAI